MFEWDNEKNKSNLEKHGISFTEAIEIFNDPVFTVIDNRQEYGELREISIGMICFNVVLTVVHTDRNGKKTHYFGAKSKQTRKAEIQ